ncbi:hypothetical protein D3C84_729850 [compost metagenome]
MLGNRHLLPLLVLGLGIGQFVLEEGGVGIDFGQLLLGSAALLLIGCVGLFYLGNLLLVVVDHAAGRLREGA